MEKFIVQSETAENIVEPLAMLKKWSPQWSSQYFMTDYSEAEIVALEEVSPIQLCTYVTSTGSSHGIDGSGIENMV